MKTDKFMLLSKNFTLLFHRTYDNLEEENHKEQRNNY